MAEVEIGRPGAAGASGGDVVRRHRLSTRVWHWINALTIVVMLMSGLMIFNAHPRLYWGEYGANFDQPWLAIGSDAESGFVEIVGVRVPTTGVLGYWHDGEGSVQRRAFPGWATIPSYYSLSSARRWHLAFAWPLAVGLLQPSLVPLAAADERRPPLAPVAQLTRLLSRLSFGTLPIKLRPAIRTSLSAGWRHDVRECLGRLRRACSGG